MKPKVLALRSIRKGSYLASRSLGKVVTFSNRVEDKATRILTGVDFSVAAFKEISFEQAFFNGIAYNIAPLNPALPAVGRKGKVTLLIPSLRQGSFYGGTATALLVASKLALASKRELRIVETLQPGGKEGLNEFFKKYKLRLKSDDVELIDVSSRSYNVYGYIDLHPDDDFIASAWWDAYVLDRLPLSRPYLYLIQDFEPIFYSNSDEYVLAENTYRSNRFIGICNTELMHSYMLRRYASLGDNLLFFEPAMSQLSSGLSIKKSPTEKRRIFLYGRPDVKRNLFFSALDALNRVFTDGRLDPNEWEVFMAGQDKVPNITLSSGLIIENLGKMSLDEYYDFIRTVDVAVSPMMAPHPNYPTLELSSIGAAVVTTKYEYKNDLSRYSKNIIMSELTVGDIADAVVQAASMPYQTRIANAEASTIPTDWNSSLDPMLLTVILRLKDSNQSSDKPARSSKLSIK